MEPQNDATLVARCLKGDRAAYDGLVRNYQNAAFGLALSYVHDAREAEELVQDAFVQGYLHLEELKRPAAFGAWLKSILVNRARQVFRKRATQRARVLNLDSAVPELDRQADETHQDRQRCAAVLTGIAHLPELYRAPLALHYFAGLSYAEIARFLDLPLSTVRGRLQKGRKRLRPLINEEHAIMSIDISEKVSEMICRIARDEISQEIDPGEVKHLFLSITVPTELHVKGYSGKKILIHGHKTAIGADSEKAETALEHIRLLHDRVDDWIATGSHRGEKFCGTARNADGTPVANIQKSGGPIYDFDGRGSNFGLGISHGDIFPHVEPTGELLARMRDSVPAQACRVSLVYEKVFDMNLPRALYSDELKEGFSGNSTRDDQLHGQVGKARLEVKVPHGMDLTLVDWPTAQTRLEDIRGNLLVLSSEAGEIADIKGDVYLLNTCAGSIRRVDGNLLGFYHDRRMGLWRDNKHHRPEPRSMCLEEIVGDIELDLGHVNLDVTGPKGHVAIRNRTGDTTVSATAWHDGTRWRLESRSGHIVIRLSEAQLKERFISVSALSGEFEFSDLADLVGDVYTGNNQRLMLFSSRPLFADSVERVDHLDAEIWATAESGDIRIEKL